MGVTENPSPYCGSENQSRSKDEPVEELDFRAFLARAAGASPAVNARTGEVQGERPWSWVKISLAVLVAALIIISGVMYLNR